MPISIDSWQRERGVGCEHIRLTVTVDGQSRVIQSSLTEIRALSGDPQEIRQAVLVLAGLRRREGRPIEGPVA